jgi:DNA polymerase
MELFLDLETRSKTDLTVVGLDNYARQAEILICAWAIDDGPVQLWQPRLGPIPFDIALEDPTVTKIAWHAPFERNVICRALGIWVDYKFWRDPSILARHLSLPGGLEAVGEILGLGDDEAKIKDGDRLIDLFCFPAREQEEQNLFGTIGIFNDWNSHPQDWEKFCDYCKRDVEAERTLWRKMSDFPLPQDDWDGWFLSEKMNDAGLPVNVSLCRKALALAERYKAEAIAELKVLTGLDNPNSPEQIKEWLSTRGFTGGSIRKDFVEQALNNPQSELTDEARKVLKLRGQAAKGSFKKLQRILDNVSPDGRLRNQFKYMGAARTGRWSSADCQVQNLPRPIKQIKKDPERALALLEAEDYGTISKEYPSVLSFVASCLRMMIQV